MKNIIFILAFTIISTTIQAQTSNVKGAKTWSIISSLMGSTYINAETILKNNNLKMYQKYNDEKLGTDTYSFIPTNSADPEYESRYFMICSSGKVVAMGVSYDYESDDITTILKDDLATIQSQITKTSYTFREKKTETINGAFGNSEVDIYTYDQNSPKSEITITHDKDMASFFMVVGAAKYQALFVQ